MNLVQTAELTRRAILILGVLIVFYIFILLIKSPIKQTFSFLFPPKDPPNLAFGVLDPLEFSEVSILNGSPEYVLNTTNGQLPGDLPTKAHVLKYIPPAFSFSEGERAQKDAATLGFTDEMRVSSLSSDVFTWQDLVLGGTLTIDTSTKTLELNTPLGGKGSLFPAGKLTQSLAIEMAKDILTKIDRFKDKLYTLDIRGYQEVKFGKFSADGVIEANSISEAQIARVDFFRKVKDFPILGPDPKQGLLQVYVRAPEITDSYPQANFPRVKAYHWEVDTENTATYPLLPINLAWEQILQNKGIISNVTPKGASPFEEHAPARADRILINSIYVAYYDSNKPQKFMQPVYVFEGTYTSRNATNSGTISIYYPAISGDYTKK